MFTSLSLMVKFGCIHSVDWTTGLSQLFSFYEQVCVLICRKKPTFFAINKYLVTMQKLFTAVFSANVCTHENR